MSATVTLSHIASVSRFGYALSDETRARILLELRAGPATPSELVANLGVSKQLVSNHLSCLRGCGLISGGRDGRNMRYSLAVPELGAALGGLLQLVLEVDPNCCEENGCGENGCACS